MQYSSTSLHKSSTLSWTLKLESRTECSSNKNKLFFPWMTNAMQSKSVALPCRRRINGQQSLREIQRWCKHTIWGSTGKKEWARWLVGPTWWQEWSIVSPAWEPAAACRRPGATPEIPYLGAHIRRSSRPRSRSDKRRCLVLVYTGGRSKICRGISTLQTGR